jgi:hypothetical protein
MSDQVPQFMSVQPPALAEAAPDNDAFAIMQQSIQLLQAAQCGLAAIGFGRAADAFEQDADEPAAVVFAGWCRASADAAKGMDFARNGDRPKAIDQLSAAVIRLKRHVLPGIAAIPDEDARKALRAGVIMDLCGAQTGVSNTEISGDIANGNFSSALRTAARIFKDIGEARAEVAAAELPTEVASQATESLSALELAIKGLEAYAKAEQATSERRWDDAATYFDDAKELLREARTAWTMSPVLASQAQIWQTLVEMLVDPARRRAEHLQDVLRELDHYKADMIALARASGETNIKLTAELAATVKTRIDLKTTIIVEFEDHTRKALNDLRAAIAAAPADTPQRNTALAEIDKVIGSDAHEEGFFERFKQFCATSADIVGNVAKAVGPVATAWNVVAPFFGLPRVPLPAG